MTWPQIKTVSLSLLAIMLTPVTSAQCQPPPQKAGEPSPLAFHVRQGLTAADYPPKPPPLGLDQLRAAAKQQNHGLDAATAPQGLSWQPPRKAPPPPHKAPPPPRKAQEWVCLKDNERKIQNAIQHVRDGRTLTVRTGTYAPPPEGDPPVYEEPRPLFFDDVNYRTQR